jgi:glycosyltransferase involved in cell wall biosynthesis
MRDGRETQEHISVCVCTYKRPVLLERLLRALETLETGDRFAYSVVVVDNDASESARPVVDRFARGAAVSVRYDVEPDRSFSLVRNRAVANAGGTHVAFIDDDEYPGSDWLFRLFRAMKEYKADGVLGPVVPEYETDPPEWVIRGKLCERETFETGTVIRSHVYTRTGNTLLDRSLFPKGRVAFDPQFGRMGGEDTDFFRRMINDGKRFVWCREAPVREWVPKERISEAYLLKRALMRGFLESKDPGARTGVSKSLLAILLYTSALPVFLLLGRHVFMTYLIRDCDHLGKVLGVCGFPLFRERTF